LRPIADEASLIETSSSVWRALPEQAWQEAFNSHPRIGQNHTQAHTTNESLRWSAQEQRRAVSEDDATKLALEEANRRYEQKFGRIFIVCANGKTAAEILTQLEARMGNDAATELREAAEQQRQITQLRLRRWLESE
jgi:2-oxo-4-hydroxy-4-carboxy-5-ureidoimidazoline decarboxylase